MTAAREPILVIGGGLAGSEAAWQIARRGIPVDLCEMRPARPTPVHRTAGLAELVCSNSLGTADAAKAPGLLKEELAQMGSLLMGCARAHRVPAGQALAVDRDAFSAAVEAALAADPLITIHRRAVDAVPRDRIAVVATGPMTSHELAQDLRGLCGADYLYFYDAASPIVTAESLDRSIVFAASRYGKGDDAAYLNCPFSREEYGAFWDALARAESVAEKPHEPLKFFEGCVPVEELARRGRDTLRFGPMKPVGLLDPRDGRRPYAVLQLRQENLAATLYNLVGFQTRLKWGDQAAVFRLIPGLANAEFVRYGVMHRNIYVNAPTQLLPTGQLRALPTAFVAGQLAGTEGYVENTASGLLCGMNAVRLAQGLPLVTPPPTTAWGALLHYLETADSKSFAPMNINFGLLPPLPRPVRSREERNALLAERARTDLAAWRLEVGDAGTRAPRAEEVPV